MTIGGKVLKLQNSAKSLRVIIGSDLSWKEQTKAKIKYCGKKPSTVRNIETVLSEVR